ncbi:LysR family transcriptional regulator [Sedimenticola hydrogenitrophicus]|uniref:LysR family transcriptional regulator n=1 Tax=Sedimenticola hydrogenitrophicus TaxID=2967975 RepID=UPI0021A86262|nr:LysR family transcriptional regulator [Sedimenticola hydrogenitrophicus]
MDIEFARTFLAVTAAGNFVGAAAKLHITQSTVSARIKTLERQLGTPLFRRGRGGAELTAAGRRFLRHAKVLVRTYEQARHDVGLSSGFSAGLTLQGRIALWDGFLPHWVEWMRRSAPDISLRLEIGFEEGIMQGLVQGDIDIGVLYTPQSRPTIAAEYIFGESLVLMTSAPDRRWQDSSYVHVDWGPEFLAQFSARFPDMDTSAQRVNIGWLAMQLISNHGGSAYFPVRLVRKLIRSQRLFPVEDSPLITLPVYMVYPLDRHEPHIVTAITGLRELGGEEDLRQSRDDLAPLA